MPGSRQRGLGRAVTELSLGMNLAIERRGGRRGGSGVMARLPWPLGAAVACGVLGLASPARAGDASLPVLRHLVYKISVSVTGKSEGHVADAIQTFGPASARAPKQGDVMTVTSNAAAAGTIVADVVAAPEDGGLVVDVSEDATSRSRHVVRVGIHPNGRLDFPPQADMSEEEGFLLRLLAREIAPEHLEAGTSWNIDEDGSDYVWRTKFRVLEMKAPDDVRLDIESSLNERKVGGVAVDSTETVEYDPSMAVPRAMRVDSRTRGQSLTTTTTTELVVVLELAEDSFRKR